MEQIEQEVEVEMTDELLSIDEELKKYKCWDPSEVDEICRKLLTDYESTFNRGERYCLCEGCYHITKKPGQY